MPWRKLLISLICVVIVADAIAYAHKLFEGRSAFLRWQPQILELMDGVDIFRAHAYPNPPIMALTLLPLAALPPKVGAMLFYFVKVALAAVTLVFSLRLVLGLR